MQDCKFSCTTQIREKKKKKKKSHLESHIILRISRNAFLQADLNDSLGENLWEAQGIRS